MATGNGDAGAGSLGRSNVGELPDSSKELWPLVMEDFEPILDSVFVRHWLQPYLSEVFQALIIRQSKDYLTLERMKQYLNLPEILADRLVRQMNANGDERIDKDEFVKFMLKMLVGTF